MKAPNKIYVEVCEDGIFAFPEPPFKESVEYIRADLVEQPLQQEQPEVELAEEAVKEYYKYAHYESGSISGEGYHLEAQGRYECNLTRDEFKEIARHFYELGKNARKEDK